ncbi:MAG: Putative type II secretion system protein F [Opitutia bacterium UBA7350]|nr:MAG: Putative type II secretion system protein F [Opitutae bacterium UBA7350]
MPTFHYRARNQTGVMKNGQLEAPDRRQAAQRLNAKGLHPLSLKIVTEENQSAMAPSQRIKTLLKALNPQKNKPADRKDILQKSSAKKEKVGLIFLQRLLELHSSGLPAGDSVKILNQRLSQPELKTLAQSLWRDLSEGSTLASALARQPDYFNSSSTHVIEAGEATGNLVPILSKVIDYLEEKQAIRQKMIASMLYPAFICTVAIGVVILFLTVLLPQIQDMLERLGSEMTWSARLLINGADLLVHYGPFVLTILVLASLALRQWRQTDTGRKRTDDWLLRLPLLGKITLYGNLFQMGNLVGTLLQSGINTTETLRLTERTINNRALRENFHTARQQVNEGLSIAHAFRRNSIMPDLALDVLAVGENTGNLAQSMSEVTKGFRQELTQRLERLTTLISTGALIAAFLLVALIAIGIVTSVFQVSQSLSI